ncbi:molybdopterin-synthase adenylyltransferase MoeB [[Haemophilus] ducreyi]|uniref:Molybdopterin-synthase adenylyltransferase n=2 Tax=Haemophilus ducreyi TaxID=730 RepID=Q7VKU8_HAEDU|nr:molybdopterin-synthase adenylyltransferase MoeB [[Haemophilus] ducreyi]AAP96520.1 molybdopterin biosynthesis protein MoeB [[Haemophilus] ducreyi 35000HP]AKO31376.1 molybdopterin-synthase adenylyltransferase [[Haemophilus] ducreyi]AKO32827.1 molybdopterin-synthase adenylyltransferase [[Haemophilus] ducreyi]AKO34276.1 molybdopterin-synthase adenylyltransferase [[Haemophilus] ducreyi]AKO35719.1 molybdopterin-synthase adenylyltransferase [[Haemophilus] ducreyi]
MELTDQEMLRYNRQIILQNVDFDGQEKLKASRVLIVGLGGLGCAAAQYLAAAGIGRLILVDFDEVSRSNLQRQILHSEANIGMPKVQSAKARLSEINPYIQIDAINQKCSSEQWASLIAKVDVVVDCTDNVEVRNQLNVQCFAQKRPLVSGSAIRFEGQISVFTYQADEPCYSCLSQLFGSGTLSCVEAGVIAPIVGVIGSLQALETIKLLLMIGTHLTGKLLIMDGLHFSIREMALPKLTTCPICHKA